MKALQHTVDITGRLEFNRRELELLQNLLTYDIKTLVVNTPNSYGGGVTTAQMTFFLEDLKRNVGECIGHINASLERARVSG